MTFVSTFCCSFVVSAPVPWAFLRIRWTASMTSLCCARNALPSSVVHWMSSARRFTASGSAGHRLDAGIPRLLRDRVGQRLVLQARVLREPLLELDDLERVGGRHEDLAEERVRVEGDRRHEGVELFGWKLRRFRRGRRGAACAVAGGAAWARNTASPGASRAAQRIATRLRLDRLGRSNRRVVRLMTASLADWRRPGSDRDRR